MREGLKSHKNALCNISMAPEAHNHLGKQLSEVRRWNSWFDSQWFDGQKLQVTAVFMGGGSPKTSTVRLNLCGLLVYRHKITEYSVKVHNTVRTKSYVTISMFNFRGCRCLN